MTNYIKIRTEFACWKLALVILLSTAAVAQEAAPSSEPPRVYVVNFTTTGSNSHYGKLSLFTPELIRLQLLEMPMVDVVRTDVPPPCGEESKTGPNAPNQFAQGRPSRPPSDFFQITGAVNLGSAEINPTDIKISGALERCQNNALVPITAQQATFAPGRALEQITVLTEFLVYQLEETLPRTQVRVEEIRTSGKDLETTAAHLTERIKLEMTQHPGFQISDKPDAAVAITGDLSKVGGTLHADMRIRWGEDVKPLKTSGQAEPESEFLRRTGESIFDLLSSESVGERFGSRDYLETASPAKLLDDGKQMLCVDQAPSCQPDARAAMRLLGAASKRSEVPDPYVLSLLGAAQSSALQYDDAVTTFTRALELSAKPDYRELATYDLNQLGDIYARKGDKGKASAYYAKSLERDPGQPDLYVGQAEIVFGTDQVAAIKLLLDGLAHNPKSDSIRSAILEDILALKPPEFKGAADLLESAKATLPVTEEYARECAFAASRLLYSDPQLAHDYLSRVEKLPPGELSASTRNWFARLEALDSSRQEKFEAARDFALKAEKIVEDEKLDDQRMSVQVLTEVDEAWAKKLPVGDHARKKLLDEIHASVEPLVLEGDTHFYQTFMETNHLSDAGGQSKDGDTESRLVFSKLLDKNGSDHYAARGVMFVCGEYLLDLNCAFEAAKKALAKPSDDFDLQLDGVEVAVLSNDRNQAFEWLKAVEQHPEADNMSKAVTGFYRFWLSYAGDAPSSKLDFQHMLTALNEYNRERAALPQGQTDSASWWSFKGASNVLNKNELPAATNLPEDKKKTLLAIIDAFDHPEQGTTGLTQLAERM